jgi:hypothetical protein
MSTYQTKSGLWVQGNHPQPATAQVPTQPVRQPSRPKAQPKQANVYDPQTGAAYRWPPKLPKAAWIVVTPLLLGMLGLLGFAILFIGAVAKNIFF